MGSNPQPSDREPSALPLDHSFAITVSNNRVRLYQKWGNFSNHYNLMTPWTENGFMMVYNFTFKTLKNPIDSDQGSISSMFYVQLLRAQILKKHTDDLTVFFTLLGSTSVKASRKMLVKLTPGVNFINVLRTAFTLVGPKSVKRYWQLDWVLTLWGTTGVKAVHRTLMKSSPGGGNIRSANASGDPAL